MIIKKKVEKKTKRDMSLEKHHLWKENNIKHTSTLIKLLERSKIDTSKCCVCKKDVEGHYRHIHHIDKTNTNNDITNLIVCCAKCHKMLDGYGKYTNYAETHNMSISGAWYRLNTEDYKKKANSNSRKYYQTNKERLLELSREYYQKNKEKIFKKHKEYCQKNKERIIKIDRAYYQRNREKILERRRLKRNGD